MTISTHQPPHATLVITSTRGIEMSIVMDMLTPEAASKALDDFPAAILSQLRGHGIIAGEGNLIDLDDAARVVSQLRAAVAPVAGQPILISEAAAKYGFSTDAIYKWIAGGWVKVLVQEPRKRIDEGDIALARALADRRGQAEGRAVFPARPRSGRPRKK